MFCSTARMENYLGRVTKARILEVVREARGTEAAERIAHLKKNDMAQAAERLLEGAGWLPEALRTANVPERTEREEGAACRIRLTITGARYSTTSIIINSSSTCRTRCR